MLPIRRDETEKSRSRDLAVPPNGASYANLGRKHPDPGNSQLDTGLTGALSSPIHETRVFARCLRIFRGLHLRVSPNFAPIEN